MTIKWQPTLGTVALMTLAMFGSGCHDKTPTSPSSNLTASLAKGRVASSGSTKGAASQMPAFYDGQQFTVNMMEMAGGAEAALIRNNGSINQIYASNDLDEEQDFVPVIDAIQGDGFNPLWRQNLIVFNPGFTPHQFHSDTEVLAAAGGANPEITIVTTDEVYRCSVVGRK
jgi:hypothetical protein